MTATKDDLIAEATELGLSEGTNLVALTKSEIQELIDAKLSEALKGEPNSLLDGEPETPAQDTEPEVAPEIDDLVAEAIPDPEPTPEPDQEKEKEKDPIVEMTIEEKCAALELENAELKSEIEYTRKVAKENEGKDRLSRLEQVKGKLEGQIKGYYKMSIFDMEELFSLI